MWIGEREKFAAAHQYTGDLAQEAEAWADRFIEQLRERSGRVAITLLRTRIMNLETMRDNSLASGAHELALCSAIKILRSVVADLEVKP